jgi:hypothetical protein
VLELTDPFDYVALFGIAAILGGVGGLVFELLQSRYGQTGWIELPGRSRGRYRDWGVWANVLVGAVAAMAALWVFPPQTQTVISQNAANTTTTTEYSIIDLFSLSLIIGSAGSSFLSSLQARVMARLKEQEATMTREVAHSQLETIKDQLAAAAEASKAQVETIRGEPPTAMAAREGDRHSAPQPAADVFSELVAHVQQAQAAVSATNVAVGPIA